MKKKRNLLLLLLTAMIWGTAFVAQSVGMDYLGPFTFNGVRSLIGGVVLLPVAALVKKRAPERKPAGNRRDLWVGGICCGLCLFFASSAQQIGIQYTTPGKAGFITAFYIVLVPVFGLFLKKKCSFRVWIAVALALIGLYFLCIDEAFTLGRGDIWVLLCAVLFAVHILVIDYFAPKASGTALSCIQFFVCGLLSCAVMAFTETPSLPAIFDAAVPLLYAGVLSCGVAYTLQIIGQKDVNPTVASLVLSLESTFSVLAGWLILHQTLSLREGIGCVVIFIAILLAQI